MRFYIKTFNFDLKHFYLTYKILKNNITKFFFYDENYTKALYRYKRSFINENDFYELTFANPFFDPYFEDLLKKERIFNITITDNEKEELFDEDYKKIYFEMKKFEKQITDVNEALEIMSDAYIYS